VVAIIVEVHVSIRRLTVNAEAQMTILFLGDKQIEVRKLRILFDFDGELNIAIYGVKKLMEVINFVVRNNCNDVV